MSESRTDASGWSWRDALPIVIGSWFVLLIGGSLVISAGGWDATDLPITAQFVATAPFWAAAVGGTWWVARRVPDPAGALGLSVRPIDVPLGIAVGVGLQLAVIPLVYWPILEVLGKTSADLDREAQRLADSAPGTVGTILFVLMASVCAPVAEELLYRGLLLRARGWSSVGVAVLVTSLLFAVSHLQPLQFLGLALFGAAAAVLVHRTGRLAPALIAHVAFNTTSVVVLLSGR